MKNYTLTGLMLGLTALLTACPGPTPPAPTNDSSRLSGTIAGWKAGAAKVTFYLTVADDIVEGSSTTIQADGSLNTTLPTPTRTASFLGNCTLNSGTTGNDVQVEYADAVAVSSSGAYLGLITQTTGDGVPVLRLYAASATTLKGSSTCSTSREEYDLSLNAGWNLITISKTESGGTPTYSYRSLPGSTTLKLGFEAVKPKVNISFPEFSYITLRAGQTVTRNVTFTADGDLSGSVNLSASLPGIKVTPGSISATGMSGQGLNVQALKSGIYAASPSKLPTRFQAQGSMMKPQRITTTLSFSLTDEATTYLGPFDLIASQDGQVLGKATMHTEIQAPTAIVTFDNAPLSVYQGVTTNLRLTVRSQNEFSGDVTLTLSGLPTGVTASPVKINIPLGAATSVNIPLQVSGDAPLGTTEVTVGGQRVQGSYGKAVFALQVKPSRTAVGRLASTELTSAAQGVWTIASSSYISSGYQSVLRRYAGGQAVQEVTLNATESSYSRLTLPIPGGDIYVLGQDKTLYRLKDDGTVTTLTLPIRVSDLSSGTADGQGRIWYLNTVSPQSNSTGLFRLDPATGTSTLIDDTRSYTNAYSGTRLTASNDGRYLIHQGPNSTLYLINTASDTIRTLDLPGNQSVTSVAVSNTGQVWFSGYNTLVRVNADGTTTIFSLKDPINQLIGFDQKDSPTLWARGGYGYTVLKINTTTTAATVIPSDSLSAAILNPGGGVTLLTGGYNFSTATSEYYLSTLP